MIRNYKVDKYTRKLGKQWSLPDRIVYWLKRCNGRCHLEGLLKLSVVWGYKENSLTPALSQLRIWGSIKWSGEEVVLTRVRFPGTSHYRHWREGVGYVPRKNKNLL